MNQEALHTRQPLWETVAAQATLSLCAPGREGGWWPMGCRAQDWGSRVRWRRLLVPELS